MILSHTILKYRQAKKIHDPAHESQQ